MDNEELFVWRVFEEWLPCKGHGAPINDYKSFENENILNELNGIREKAKSGFLSKNKLCKYCSTRLYYYNLSGNDVETYIYCHFCGWSFSEVSIDDRHGDWVSHNKQESQLCHFDVNSNELLIEELAYYLKSNYKMIGALDPYKFEKLIGDLFKEHGYLVEHTKMTRDGGKDLILFDKGGNKKIVEVKRYAGKVGVSIVRQLAGVQLINDYQKAILVTSSSYTKDAIKESSSSSYIEKGYTMNLMDAEDILRMLSVYENPQSIAEVASRYK